MSDIFMSYSSGDRDWAFWIAWELEALGHTPHLHDWEIAAGGDITRWMEERLERADYVLCIVSSEFLAKPNSSWERRAIVWSAVKSRSDFVLPVFVEDCDSPTFLKRFERCDLYGIGKEEARARLEQYLAPATKPTTSVRFPEAMATKNDLAREPPTFPGLHRGPALRQPRNLPFASLGGLFVGRSEALENLHRLLAERRDAIVAGCALVGVGGIGKTRLAVEYAWSREGDYSALLFASANDPAMLDASLAALVHSGILDLPQKEAPEEAAKIDAVLRWLEANPAWLLILDDVDDDRTAAAVGQLMARLKGGHVIITGRSAIFPTSIPILRLDVLDESSAAELLLRSTSESRKRTTDDSSGARAIARELEGLPLAIEQACTYVATQSIGFQQYATRLHDGRDRIINSHERTSTGDRFEIAVAAACRTSIDRLSPESRRLLERLAMLAAAPIPASLIDVTVPGETSDYDAYEACAGLLADALVQREADVVSPGTYIIHRLVQDFVRGSMTDQRRNSSLLETLAWVDAAFVGDPQDERARLTLDPLVPHALAVAQRADDAGIAEPTAGLLNKIGLVLNAKGHVHEAESLILRALAIHETAHGPDSLQTATTLNNLANLLQDRGRYADAELLYRRALATFETTLGPNDPAVAIGLNNLAQLLANTGQFTEAEQLMRRALVNYMSAFGEDHPAVALSLSNLAMLLQIEGRFDEAESFYVRALKIREKVLGPENLAVATILNNLASLLRDTKRFAEAEQLYRRVLAIFEKSFGSDHPSTARARDNLAAIAGTKRQRRPQGSATK